MNPPTANPQHSNQTYKTIKTIHIADTFKKVAGLGCGIPIVLLIKYQKESVELVRHRTTFIQEGKQSRFRPLLKPLRTEKWEGGTAVAFILDGTLKPKEPLWIVKGEEVRGFARSKDLRVVAFVNHLSVYDDHNGKLLKTIHHPYFKNLHSVAFQPNNPNRLLLSNTGLDTVLEVDIETGQITWSWEAITQGYGINPFGVHLINKNSPLTCEHPIRRVSWQQAKERMSHHNALPDGEVWGVEVDPDSVKHPLGLEKWLKGAEPNWVGYDLDGETLLASFFVANQVVKIKRDSGAVQVVLRDLSRPHGLIPYPGGYLVSDTRKGVVVTLNQEFSVEKRYDFSTLPLPNTLSYQDGEWLQFTHPIGGGLLATVDGRRYQVIIWDPDQHLYSIYPFPDHWSVHAVLGF